LFCIDITKFNFFLCKPRVIFPEWFPLELAWLFSYARFSLKPIIALSTSKRQCFKKQSLFKLYNIIQLKFHVVLWEIFNFIYEHEWTRLASIMKCKIKSTYLHSILPKDKRFWFYILKQRQVLHIRIHMLIQRKRLLFSVLQWSLMKLSIFRNFVQIFWKHIGPMTLRPKKSLDLFVIAFYYPLNSLYLQVLQLFYS
jgi:hypothetical protein